MTRMELIDWLEKEIAAFPGKTSLLMMDLQPGSLGVRAGHLIGEREAEILRAATLREELSRLAAE